MDQREQPSPLVRLPRRHGLDARDRHPQSEVADLTADDFDAQMQALSRGLTMAMDMVAPTTQPLGAIEQIEPRRGAAVDPIDQVAHVLLGARITINGSLAE